MKLRVIACILSLVFVTACSAQETPAAQATQQAQISPEQSSSVQAPIGQEEQEIQEDEPVQEEQTEQQERTEQGASSEVDVDLTQLSATMVYSQVYDLLSNYPDYLGKSMKIYGNIDNFTDVATGETLYAVIINDALGCCPQGIELEFPEEFEIPEWGTPILIEGVVSIIAVGEDEFVVLEVYHMIF